MKNIGIVLVVSLLASSAFGSDLDKAVDKVNQDLNPKNANDIGYEVDYRQETNGKMYTWININLVKKVCGPLTTAHIRGGKIAKVTENTCSNKWVMEQNSLFQINCLKTTGQSCISNLTKELSTEVVKQIIAQKLRNAYVQ